MEDKYLYPGEAAHHLGFPNDINGNDYVDFMLSNVLASNECSIRDLRLYSEDGIVKFSVRWYRNKDSKKVEGGIYHDIRSECSAEKLGYKVALTRFDDLRLRYRRNEDGTYSRPVWVDAFDFGNGRFRCPMYILRADGARVEIIE